MSEEKHIETAETVAGIWLFWTASPRIISRLIRWVTGERTHMGLGVLYTDGRREYLEARKFKSVAPPRSIAALLRFQARRPGNRVWFLFLDRLTPRQASRIWARASADVGRVGYAPLQFPGHWFYERIGRHIGLHLRRTPGHVTCAEWAGRKLLPEIDVREDGRTFDELTPESVWNYCEKRSCADRNKTQMVVTGKRGGQC